MVGDHKLTLYAAEDINTVGNLKQFLIKKYPSLQTLPSWAIAVEGDCANDATLIHNNSEIALLPPVSGG